jgi:hypothetical protein
MREYKMGRGEYLDERIESIEFDEEEYEYEYITGVDISSVDGLEDIDDVEGVADLVALCFGTATDSETHSGSELLVVEEPRNPVFERVTAGVVEYSSKKDRLALDIEERPAEEVIAEGHFDAAEEAVSAKNEFLRAGTGRDAKARRESMKRDVEDDETPDNVA